MCLKMVVEALVPAREVSIDQQKWGNRRRIQYHTREIDTMNFRTTLFMIASSLAVLSSLQAFSTSSSFTRRLPSSSATTTVSTSSSSYRSTALSMNLFDRFQRVAKANINNVLKSLEDPEKIMSQALEDMQVSINDQYMTSSLHFIFTLYMMLFNVTFSNTDRITPFIALNRLIWSKSVNPMQKLPPLNVDY